MFNTANYYQDFTVLLTTYISSPTARDDDQHVKKHPRLGDVETAQKEIERAPFGVQLNAAHFGCWLKAEMVLKKREKRLARMRWL